MLLIGLSHSQYRWINLFVIGNVYFVRLKTNLEMVSKYNTVMLNGLLADKIGIYVYEFVWIFYQCNNAIFEFVWILST